MLRRVVHYENNIFDDDQKRNTSPAKKPSSLSSCDSQTPDDGTCVACHRTSRRDVDTPEYWRRVRSLSRDNKKRMDARETQWRLAELEETKRRKEILFQRRKEKEDLTYRFMRRPLRVVRNSSSESADEKLSNITVSRSVPDLEEAFKIMQKEQMARAKSQGVLSSSCEDWQLTREKQSPLIRRRYTHSQRYHQTTPTSSPMKRSSQGRVIRENQKAYPTRPIEELKARQSLYSSTTRASSCATTGRRERKYKAERETVSIDSFSLPDSRMIVVQGPKIIRRRSMPDLTKCKCISSTMVYESISALHQTVDTPGLILLRKNSKQQQFKNKTLNHSHNEKQLKEIINNELEFTDGISIPTIEDRKIIKNGEKHSQSAITIAKRREWTAEQMSKKEMKRKVLSGEKEGTTCSTNLRRHSKPVPTTLTTPSLASEGNDSTYYDSLEEDNVKEDSVKKSFFVPLEGKLQDEPPSNILLPPRLSNRLEILKNVLQRPRTASDTVRGLNLRGKKVHPLQIEALLLSEGFEYTEIREINENSMQKLESVEPTKLAFPVGGLSKLPQVDQSQTNVDVNNSSHNVKNVSLITGGSIFNSVSDNDLLNVSELEKRGISPDNLLNTFPTTGNRINTIKSNISNCPSVKLKSVGHGSQVSVKVAFNSNIPLETSTLNADINIKKYSHNSENDAVDINTLSSVSSDPSLSGVVENNETFSIESASDCPSLTEVAMNEESNFPTDLNLIGSTSALTVNERNELNYAAVNDHLDEHYIKVIEGFAANGHEALLESGFGDDESYGSDHDTSTESFSSSHDGIKNISHKKTNHVGEDEKKTDITKKLEAKAKNERVEENQDVDLFQDKVQLKVSDHNEQTQLTNENGTFYNNEEAEEAKEAEAEAEEVEAEEAVDCFVEEQANEQQYLEDPDVINEGIEDKNSLSNTGDMYSVSENQDCDVFIDSGLSEIARNESVNEECTTTIDKRESEEVITDSNNEWKEANFLDKTVDDCYENNGGDDKCQEKSVNNSTNCEETNQAYNDENDCDEHNEQSSELNSIEKTVFPKSVKGCDTESSLQETNEEYNDQINLNITAQEYTQNGDDIISETNFAIKHEEYCDNNVENDHIDTDKCLETEIPNATDILPCNEPSYTDLAQSDVVVAGNLDLESHSVNEEPPESLSEKSNASEESHRDGNVKINETKDMLEDGGNDEVTSNCTPTHEIASEENSASLTNPEMEMSNEVDECSNYKTHTCDLLMNADITKEIDTNNLDSNQITKEDSGTLTFDFAEATTVQINDELVEEPEEPSGSVDNEGSVEEGLQEEKQEEITEDVKHIEDTTNQEDSEWSSQNQGIDGGTLEDKIHDEFNVECDDSMQCQFSELREETLSLDENVPSSVHIQKTDSTEQLYEKSDTTAQFQEISGDNIHTEETADFLETPVEQEYESSESSEINEPSDKEEQLKLCEVKNNEKYASNTEMVIAETETSMDNSEVYLITNDENIDESSFATNENETEVVDTEYGSVNIEYSETNVDMVAESTEKNSSHANGHSSVLAKENLHEQERELHELDVEEGQKLETVSYIDNDESVDDDMSKEESITESVKDYSNLTTHNENENEKTNIEDEDNDGPTSGDVQECVENHEETDSTTDCEAVMIETTENEFSIEKDSDRVCEDSVERGNEEIAQSFEDLNLVSPAIGEEGSESSVSSDRVTVIRNLRSNSRNSFSANSTYNVSDIEVDPASDVYSNVEDNQVSEDNDRPIIQEDASINDESDNVNNVDNVKYIENVMSEEIVDGVLENNFNTTKPFFSNEQVYSNENPAHEEILDNENADPNVYDDLILDEDDLTNVCRDEMRSADLLAEIFTAVTSTEEHGLQQNIDSSSDLSTIEEENEQSSDTFEEHKTDTSRQETLLQIQNEQEQLLSENNLNSNVKTESISTSEEIDEIQHSFEFINESISSKDVETNDQVHHLDSTEEVEHINSSTENIAIKETESTINYDTSYHEESESEGSHTNENDKSNNLSPSLAKENSGPGLSTTEDFIPSSEDTTKDVTLASSNSSLKIDYEEDISEASTLTTCSKVSAHENYTSKDIPDALESIDKTLEGEDVSNEEITSAKHVSECDLVCDKVTAQPNSCIDSYFDNPEELNSHSVVTNAVIKPMLNVVQLDYFQVPNERSLLKYNTEHKKGSSISKPKLKNIKFSSIDGKSSSTKTSLGENNFSKSFEVVGFRTDNVIDLEKSPYTSVDPDLASETKNRNDESSIFVSNTGSNAHRPICEIRTLVVSQRNTSNQRNTSFDQADLTLSSKSPSSDSGVMELAGPCKQVLHNRNLLKKEGREDPISSDQLSESQTLQTVLENREKTLSTILLDPFHNEEAESATSLSDFSRCDGVSGDLPNTPLCTDSETSQNRRKSFVRDYVEELSNRKSSKKNYSSAGKFSSQKIQHPLSSDDESEANSEYALRLLRAFETRRRRRHRNRLPNIDIEEPTIKDYKPHLLSSFDAFLTSISNYQSEEYDEHSDNSAESRTTQSKDVTVEVSTAKGVHDVKVRAENNVRLLVEVTPSGSRKKFKMTPESLPHLPTSPSGLFSRRKHNKRKMTRSETSSEESWREPRFNNYVGNQPGFQEMEFLRRSSSLKSLNERGSDLSVEGSSIEKCFTAPSTGAYRHFLNVQNRVGPVQPGQKQLEDCDVREQRRVQRSIKAIKSLLKTLT